jgi:hypothetical protein
MGFAASDVVIEYCTAANCYSLFRPKYDWFGYTVRYNHIYDVKTFLQHLCVPSSYGGRVSIHNNLAFASSGDYMYEASETAANADVYNNTIVIAKPGSEGAAIRWWKKAGEAPNTSKYYNNILAFGSAPSGRYRVHAFGGVAGVGYSQQFQLMDYNAYTDLGSGYFSVSNGDVYEPTSSWSGLGTWRSASGFEAHSVQSNPGFVDGSGVNPESYKLGERSVCRGAGRVGGVSSGAAIDMGCWTQGVSAIGARINKSPVLPPVAPQLQVR